MRNESALVSIIMPVYNAVNFIQIAIESVIAQSYSNWELIIINDGSTDSTIEITLSFLDKRIKYFEQENKGVSAARNVGLEKMKGEYFCFLDADDALPPNSLEVRIRKFFENQEITFIDGRVSVRDQYLKSEIGKFVPAKRGQIFNDLVRLNETCYFGPSWLIKRKPNKIYKMIEGLSHAEDLCFYLSLAKDGLYDYVDEEVLWYRKGHTSAMSNVKGLEKGYHFYFDYAKSLGAEKKDLTYLKWRLRRIIFLSYLFDNKAPWAALKSIFHKYK